MLSRTALLAALLLTGCDDASDAKINEQPQGEVDTGAVSDDLPTCDDGVLNGDEEDIDCGGSDCAPCEEPECVIGADCEAGVCEAGVCLAAACDDGVLNGDETDIDCGGGCEQCLVDQTCETSDDCAESICLDGACERAMVITGVAAAEDAVVDEYAQSQRLTRVDFAAPPTVADFDGQPFGLPVSNNAFVRANLTTALDSVEIRVNGAALVSPTFDVDYQAIAPSFFGVVLHHSDSDSALDSIDVLDALELDGAPVEIIVIDTTR